jgi:uncharacterized protein (DUF1684 family)
MPSRVSCSLPSTWRRVLPAMVMACGLAACGADEGPSQVERDALAARERAAAQVAVVHARQVRQVREERLERLQKPDGWLSLVGLHWLQPGNSFVGTGATKGIRLAVGPEELGMIALEGERIRFRPSPGAAVTFDGTPARGTRELMSDADGGTPTVVGFNGGEASFIVIKRGDRFGLRVRDAQAPTRVGFTGLDYFEINPAFRFDARFEAHPPGQTLGIINVLGIEEPMANPGALVFEKDGVSYRLEAVDEGDGRLFLIFADRTSGHESYPASRFLYAERPSGRGTTVVDFNLAYNPPCAFTEFSTCPLPPAANRLDLRIEAGEKKPRKPAGG